MRQNLLVALIALSLLAAPCAIAQTAGSSTERWQFAVTPYVWLPNVDGTLKFSVPPGAGGSPEVDVGPNDYLSNLDFALFLAGEARRGRWAIITDIIYLDFSNEEGAVKSVTSPGGSVQVANANTQTGVKGLVWALAASYTVSRSSASTFDVLGGLRYAGLEASVDWQLAGPVGLLPQSGSFSQKVDLWDAIIGVRGIARLGEGGGWFVPYHLDVGTGSSALTWQGMAGIGYTFKWGDVLLAYRHLYYDQKGDKLIQDMRFSGPALGATIRF